MDFLARAGAFVDRGHRLAGILLVVCLALGGLYMLQLGSNARLNSEMNYLRVTMPVYVVPAATTGIYEPTRDELLVRAFADFASQSFNTFTAETFERQVAEVKGFMTNRMLTDAPAYFERKVRNMQQERWASVFVPDRASFAVRNYTQDGVEMRDVTLKGTLKTIIAGTVAEDLPLQINMTLEKVLVSRVNPFGFQLAQYAEQVAQNPALTGGVPPVMAPTAPDASPNASPLPTQPASGTFDQQSSVP